MSNHRIDIDDLAETFKALSNPQRLKIFFKLATCCLPGCCSGNPGSLRHCVGELGEDLNLAQSTVSHHLKELRQAGLMRVERRGKKIECWVNEDAITKLAAIFGDPQGIAIEANRGKPTKGRGERRGKRAS